MRFLGNFEELIFPHANLLRFTAGMLDDGDVFAGIDLAEGGIELEPAVVVQRCAAQKGLGIDADQGEQQAPGGEEPS